MGTREARDAEAAWVERTLDLTLRSISALAETAAPAAGVEAMNAIRDLVDHAVLWAERLAALRGVPDRSEGRAWEATDTERIAFAALRGRVASSLIARLGAAAGPLGPETRRAALCCAPDLERHARRAASELALAERRGLSERIRRAREALPSRQEFLREPLAPERPPRVPDVASPRTCPTAPRRAFSAA